MNQTPSAYDMAALERLLVQAVIGTAQDFI